MGWGRGRTCKSTGASLASKAGVFALSGCAAKGQMFPVSPPPSKSGLGAAKSPLLSDLPRFKLRSFNQVMLRDLQAFGEPRSGLQLCLTDTKEELPTTKTVAERNNFALKSASVSYLKIPAVDSKPKRTMINYTTKAEYYLQKQNQITLIPTMEGKNTPPNKKKTTESIQQGGTASAWEPPAAGQHVCLCSCHCSLFWRWKSICFSFFCKIHLDAVF